MSIFPRSRSREEAVSIASARTTRTYERPRDAKGNILSPSDYFGCNTFSFDLMAARLTSDELKHLKEYAVRSEPLTEELANKVATAVREWAHSKGATHYCHWFQPQTGSTAEKHDAFLTFDSNSKPIEKFSGKMLIQSEPDASSFPSGGRRSTFEARGYTAWDASSPMFLRESENGMTLCIPSLFLSYTGEALDQKTPLLKSIQALSHHAAEALQLMGEKGVSYVATTAGPEQEYFVVDEALHNLRPDLVLCGRTLFGRVPPKGQQLEDHYFGSIKPRILSFMIECENELFKLGVPVKTRHNEVAPSQCETAPIFEFANVAADHNHLVMEVLKSTAKRHNLVVMFHEKPYPGMNGSGKHVNWSMADNKGNNLLEPGDNPHQNLRFLYFLCASIKAIHDHGDLMRAAVASAGNDFRLGANEAPPAIMSVFLGETLTEVLDKLGSGNMTIRERRINVDLARVPVINKDNTDRNRTSPFAFTGNKFEFRAVGASFSISPALTYLNTAVSESLKEMNQRVRTRCGGKTASDEDLVAVIQEVIHETKKIRFEGNNYSKEWHAEAAKRGLPNLPDTPAALEVLKSAKNVKLFENFQVYNHEESESRYKVQVERYIKIRLIELETMLELMSTHALPAATMQLAAFGDAARASKEITGKTPEDMKSSFENLANLCAALKTSKARIQKLINDVAKMEDEEAAARKLADSGNALMAEASAVIYDIELECDDQYWSLPKTRELVYMI
jgi:glutamine synthetase